ncbi:hypothetical protein [Candidatus Poriferisodalis sp.]|uniref:hypothetical protein n=1 Tax=Candidatus Poriferisodalis sp. TaxID=3101277 RepID=UPI003AF52E17
MARDMYARLTATRVAMESQPASTAGALLFLDLEIEDVERAVEALGHLRRMSPVGLGNVAMVVVRWPNPDEPAEPAARSLLELLRDQLDALRVSASIGLVSVRVGEQHSIQWLDGQNSDGAQESFDLQVLVRCRQVELATLIKNGRALWQPEHYHYRLPSGRHSGSFVRLADAVRSVRDADVLAWWLLSDVESGSGLVIDTSTIVPIALALRSQCAAAGVQLGALHSLRSYPATLSEFARAVRDASIRNAPVLALLSVSSTGTLKERLVTALKSVVGDRWRMHVFVDKLGTEATAFDSSLGDLVGNTCTWFCTDIDDTYRSELPAQACKLCKSGTRARVVQIDPRSFDGLVLPDPKLVTPDIRFAEQSGDFWSICDGANALALDVEPHPSSAPFRPHRFTMGIRVDFDPLLVKPEPVSLPTSSNPPSASPEPAEAGQSPKSVETLQEAASKFLARLVDNSPDSFPARSQLFVGLASEFQRGDGAGEAFFRTLLGNVRPGVEVHAVSAQEEHASKELRELIKSRDQICLVALGVVTGASLHNVLAYIQHVRRDLNLPAAEVGALVIHLRPPSERERSTIINPFGSSRFHAIYESLLPYGRSPMRDEQDYLNSLSHWTEIETIDYFRTRLDYLREGSLDAQENMGIFWGLDKDDPVIMRPGSWYGESLSGLATLIAVGSAIQRRRHVQETAGIAPEWRQFEIPAVFRSYYDPFIVASVLRWLQPEECWWGREVDASVQVVRELLNSYSSQHDRRLIIGELLLAAALGKVPVPAVSIVRDQARGVLENSEQERALGAIEMGLAILDKEFPADE